jgi:hypothetical protein
MHPLMAAAVEQHLAELSEDEWAALAARVRPPGQVQPPVDQSEPASPDVMIQGG